MSQGEQKCVTLQPAEAFGTVQDRLIREVPRGSIHTSSPLVGMLLAGRRVGRRKVRIVELKQESVVIDGNHPRAGRPVNLAMYLLSVDASSETNQSKPQLNSGDES
jgi:FKBP-type peptidyl-prolyl cis-trans isomerase 2